MRQIDHVPPFPVKIQILLRNCLILWLKPVLEGFGPLNINVAQTWVCRILKSILGMLLVITLLKKQKFILCLSYSYIRHWSQSILMVEFKHMAFHTQYSCGIKSYLNRCFHIGLNRICRMLFLSDRNLKVTISFLSLIRFYNSSALVKFFESKFASFWLLCLQFSKQQ